MQGLREEDDDEHAGTADAGDAHDELLVVVEDISNEAGYRRQGYR